MFSLRYVLAGLRAQRVTTNASGLPRHLRVGKQRRSSSNGRKAARRPREADPETVAVAREQRALRGRGDRGGAWGVRPEMEAAVCGQDWNTRPLC